MSGAEGMSIVLLIVSYALIVGAMALGVYQDARHLGKRRGRGQQLSANAEVWALGCFLLPVIVLPIYIAKRAGVIRMGGAAADQRDCPFCAERIKRRAQVCRFCGAALDPKK